MRYIVHFTENSVLSNDEYKSWMASFGESVEHIIVNGSGPCLPHMEAVYRINVILNHICPKLFPPLHPKGFNGTIQQVITEFDNAWYRLVSDVSTFSKKYACRM